ncbi:hypothetical protein ACJMK2_008451, partial [Sinanodonta woodiana]
MGNSFHIPLLLYEKEHSDASQLKICSLAHVHDMLVAVEGNIGCGKSTFLDYFKDIPNVEEMMYNDPKRWSMAFQSYVQLTMIGIHSKESVHGIKLMERSLYSARYCFVENCYRSKLMQELEYVILSEFYNWIKENHDMHVDLI